MTKISLVISDVDGTLVTSDKRLTDAARAAVDRLHQAGIGFTITSSRPPFGMRMIAKPLGVTLPIGPFNGSTIVEPNLTPVETHFIPEAAARRSVELLTKAGVDIWLFTPDRWLIMRDDGKYVPHEHKTIEFEPTYTTDFTPYLTKACKIVGASADAALLERCESDLQHALGDTALAVRSQTYYLDVTPPDFDKGTFVRSIAKRLGIALSDIVTIGDGYNDTAMFKVSGTSIAMGNASDAVKKLATMTTASNEEDGFAKAIDRLLG